MRRSCPCTRPSPRRPAPEAPPGDPRQKASPGSTSARNRGPRAGRSRPPPRLRARAMSCAIGPTPATPVPGGRGGRWMTGGRASPDTPPRTSATMLAAGASGTPSEERAEAKQEPEAVACAGRRGEEDDGIGWMHGSVSRSAAGRSRRRAAPAGPRGGDRFSAAHRRAGYVGRGAGRQVLVDRLVAEFFQEIETAAPPRSATHRCRDRPGRRRPARRWGRPGRRRVPGLPRAGLVVDAIHAERAFLHHAVIVVVFPRAVGAGPGTQLAADAGVGLTRTIPSSARL
jgi:hypothetical protein